MRVNCRNIRGERFECKVLRNGRTMCQGAVMVVFGLGYRKCRSTELLLSLGHAGKWVLTLALVTLLGSTTVRAQLSTRGASTSASPAAEASLPTPEELSERLQALQAQMEALQTRLSEEARGEDSSAEAGSSTDVGTPADVRALTLLLAELGRLRSENASLQEQLKAAQNTQEEVASFQGEAQIQLENRTQPKLEGAGGATRVLQAELESPSGEAQVQNRNAREDASNSRSQLGQAGSQQADDASMRESELTELQGQFAQLLSRQDDVSSQLQAITDEHAALLGQLDNAAPETATSPLASQQTHVVRSGDTLSALAQAFYGSASRWPKIMAANPFLTDPNQLLMGTVLVIP